MHYLNDHRFLSWVLGLVAGGALLSVPLSASSESPAQHDQHISMSHQTPEWAERLKGQTVVEDTLEGRPNRAAMVEQQHERIMHQMAKDPQAATGQHWHVQLHDHAAPVRCGQSGHAADVRSSDWNPSLRADDVRRMRRCGSTTSRRSTSKSRSISGSISIPATCTY